MWELDPREGWVSMDWCFQTLVFEKTLESSLDCREIKPVNLKGNQSWIFIGRTDAEAEAPMFWPPGTMSQPLRKDLFWERLKTGGEGDDRGQDDWMASWTWVRHESQRVGHNWAAEMNY